MNPQTTNPESTEEVPAGAKLAAPLQLTEAHLAQPDGGMHVKTNVKAGDLTIKQKITEGP